MTNMTPRTGEKEFTSMDEVVIGSFVLDTYNNFNNPEYKFIQGQEFCPEKAHVKIINKTSNSVCVSLKKFPLRIVPSDGSISKPIECTHWYKFKREHEYEIGFPYRFKKLIS